MAKYLDLSGLSYFWEKIKSIIPGTSNPNYIDNAWFTVNQRDQSSYTQPGYFVDRWKWQSGQGAILTTHEGIYIDNPSSIRLRQVIPFITYETLLDKNVTLSVILDDYVYSVSGTIPDTWPSEDTVLLSQETSNYRLKLDLMSYGAIRVEVFIYATMTIKAVKLEFSPYSTLANDAPPDYETELEKCKYHFRRLKASGAANILTGTATSATSAEFYLPGEMYENAGTISKSGTITVNGKSVTAVAQVQTSEGIIITATSSGLTAYNGAVLNFANGAYIDITHETA